MRAILLVLLAALLFVACSPPPAAPLPTATPLPAVLNTRAPTATRPADTAAPTMLPPTVTRPSTTETAPLTPAPSRPATATRAARPIFAAPAKSPLIWAQQLVQNLLLARTAYEHKVTTVTWAGVGGASEYASYADCSGFMNALLTQAYDLSLADLEAWLGEARPLAKDYFGAMLAARGFIPLKNIAGVQPGDLISIRYLNSAPGDNTGHVLLVAAAPQKRAPAKPIVGATEQWDVPVIDSSESGHGKDDTRRLPDGTFHDGVGRGLMRIYTDSAGMLAGYAWSDLSDSVYYDAASRPLAIGRLNPKFSLP